MGSATVPVAVFSVPLNTSLVILGVRGVALFSLARRRRSGQRACPEPVEGPLLVHWQSLTSAAPPLRHAISPSLLRSLIAHAVKTLRHDRQERRLPIRTVPGEVRQRGPGTRRRTVRVLHDVRIIGHGVEPELDLSVRHRRAEQLHRHVARDDQTRSAGCDRTQFVGHDRE